MKAILFDLDNTMYDVRQYFLPAFMEVAGYLSKKHAVSRGVAYKRLVAIWEEKTSSYPLLFNDAMVALGVKDPGAIASAVKIFNRHHCRLTPYSGLIAALKRLKKHGYKLGVITDGNPARQARKIASLGIKDFFDVVVYAKEIADKPSSKPFREAAKRLKVYPKDALYVGDDPKVDFKGAKKAGMKTARVLLGQFKGLKNDSYVDFQISAFKDLIFIIQNI